MKKNILIFAGTSQIAQNLSKKLLLSGANLFVTHRSPLEFEHENLKKFKLDLTDDFAVLDFFKKISGVKFSAVICFQGVAISSPVENLSRENLQKQLDVSLFSLLRILNNIRPFICGGGIFVNVSSMAAFGLFPYLAPYSIAKSAADTLLGCFEIETGIKTVSIKPGVVGTKFWEYCIKQNDFKNFSNGYEQSAEFLKANALKNSTRGLCPKNVSDIIFRAINSKNPKASYLVGNDALFTAVAANFKGRVLYTLIRKILKRRIKRFLND